MKIPMFKSVYSNNVDKSIISSSCACLFILPLMCAEGSGSVQRKTSLYT
jgi:hypothetical protein